MSWYYISIVKKKWLYSLGFMVGVLDFLGVLGFVCLVVVVVFVVF